MIIKTKMRITPNQKLKSLSYPQIRNKSAKTLFCKGNGLLQSHLCNHISVSNNLERSNPPL